MENSTEEAGLRARIEALEALVRILAQQLSADYGVRQQIAKLIDREAQSLIDGSDPEGAAALRSLQKGLEESLNFGD